MSLLADEPPVADEAEPVTHVVKRPRHDGRTSHAEEEDALTLLALLTDVPVEQEGLDALEGQPARSTSAQSTQDESPLSPEDDSDCPLTACTREDCNPTQSLQEAIWAGDASACAACLRFSKPEGTRPADQHVPVRPVLATATTSKSPARDPRTRPRADARSPRSPRTRRPSSRAAVSLVLREGSHDRYGEPLAPGDSWPLLDAAAEGHLEIARLLLTTGRSPVDIPDEIGGDGRWDTPPMWTPLLCAAARGDDAMVELLLHHGASPLRIDPRNGERPIERASRVVDAGGSLRARRCCRLLLEAMEAYTPRTSPPCDCAWHRAPAPSASAGAPARCAPCGADDASPSDAPSGVGASSSAAAAAGRPPFGYHDLLRRRLLEQSSGPTFAAPTRRPYRPSPLGPNWRPREKEPWEIDSDDDGGGRGRLLADSSDSEDGLLDDDADGAEACSDSDAEEGEVSGAASSFGWPL